MPAELRKKYNLGPDSKLEWLDYRGLIVALPVTGDPIKAARGLTRGEGLRSRLLDTRKQDRSREQKEAPRPGNRHAH